MLMEVRMRQITEEEFFMYQTLISPNDRSTIVYADEVNG